MTKSAVFSNDRLFRYSLERCWNNAKPTCVFIGLNPSTADENADDPTIRRCMGFAASFDCGSLMMLNLYGYRSTDWKKLRGIAGPVGYMADNDIPGYIRSLARYEIDGKYSGPIIAAWGGNVDAIDGGTRAREVATAVADLKALRISAKTGHPYHPLYLPKNSPLIPFAYPQCK